MTKTIRNLSAVLILLALLGGAAAWIYGGALSLFNFETGYVSGAFVIAASAFGYWQMVAESGESVPHHGLPDIVDQIDDRYGLWEEEDIETGDDVKTVLREEKARRKESRRDFKTFLKTTKPALSLYRVAAYIILVAGVYYLIRSGVFEPVLYLMGVGLAPLATAAVLYVNR